MASVAMIGCIPTKATRPPFTKPARAPTRSATSSATGQPYPRYSGRNAEARAITDPTERSMPSVPIASATPRETSTMGETWIRRLVRVAVEAKLGVTIRLKTTRATKAMYTPRPRTRETRVDLSRDLPTAALFIRAFSVSGRLVSRILAVRKHLHQFVFGDLLSGEQPDHGPVPQGDHAVAALRELAQLRGD